MSETAVPVRVRASAVTVLAGVALLYIGRVAAPVVVPVLVSILLAYALEPAVQLLMRCRLPRIASAVLIYLGLAVLGGSLIRSGADQVTSFLNDLPATVATFRAAIAPAPHAAPSTLARVQQAAAELEKAATTTSEPTPGVRRVTVVAQRFDVREFLLRASRGAVTTTVDLFIVLLLTFLLLATGDLYKRKLVKLGGQTLTQKKVTVEVIRDIDRQIERYLVVRVLISLVVAVLTAIGLWAIGLEHALIWGILAGALNVLPFVGSGVAIVLIALAAFLQFNSLPVGAEAGAITLLVAVIEANALTPWLSSRAGDLNTVALFVGVLFWGWLWDFWGLVLAVPIMVAIKAAADHIEPLAPIGELLGE